MCENNNNEVQEQLKMFPESELKAIEKNTGTEIIDTFEEKTDGVQLKIEFAN
ncbi:hypothetical protein K9M48_01050 [Candidatus Gracilibacteria bacterium]|nr:hypothetical protein [Candidatus Gracilibacteria bacterium]